MVGNHLHSTFRTWFKDTEADGTPRPPRELSDKYDLGAIIGQGSFACVKMCRVRATGEDRALKIIARKPLSSRSGADKEKANVTQELEILRRVHHPNVIRMYDMFTSKEGVFIVTDLCKGGELFDSLVERVAYNEVDARYIMQQIFSGVKYLHSQHIVHRDLKPENILLREKNSNDVVISDFGLSKVVTDDEAMLTACGSPQYVSPELLLGKGYTTATDIWSAGVISYCLLGGYTPFYGPDQPSLFQHIIGMRVEFEPAYWAEISDTAKDFILKCLCPAEVRMTAEQALEHPWLASLPDQHDPEHRGACLKECAKRAKDTHSKLSRAVTAVEVVAYLQRLHKLREEGGATPERLASLSDLSDVLRKHKRGDSLLVSAARGEVQAAHDRILKEDVRTATRKATAAGLHIDPTALASTETITADTVMTSSPTSATF
ncbi:hypothetical protein CF319_g3257 [Tilletia indica]|uniref:Protein kinase domain-containing protein n=1 Tax=Tilletia walkeri TaxID=117179 RepID=A0A8X7T430_9BASI|nr:hypothetical protein CF327_g4905 [Tilletia walkeri]KAE8223761.1 hypothetical protein CF319_g3257 [Tilletia indica]KAE8266943.1 hypothetical protein A4X09_0g5403 [Tilletia walkeri]